jgi:hypothetical protein
VGLPSLKAVDIRMVFRGSHVSIGLLRREYRLNPCLRFRNQIFIAEDICERKKAVEPVWSPLPGISIASKPGIIGSDYLRIDFIKVSSQSGRLQAKLLLKPSLSLDRAKRKGGITGGFQRSPVKHLSMRENSSQ